MTIRDMMAKAIKAVEYMYDKTAEIKRYEPYTKPSGADGMQWVTKHIDVPCRTSSTTLNTSTQGDANLIEYDVKLFLSPAYDVLAGDGFIINGTKYESAKEPFVYVSHQEVLLIRKAFA
ncbi:hypothetical protein HMPREF1210_01141 [Paenisporosarcina sp. HGH0030]|uniref:hypothetical protein n=1 Tax=Paenisporosarcina sp. HGH0030 TaxID=1078085 RepID=UPI00034EC4E1|nr:hypothetical protein [Paenisporosarcina sp. HGH0030]EPD52761.1 hypothetical protein HMPREF1210_01141 [Paenisporosarcina sp. HGH0030]